MIRIIGLTFLCSCGGASSTVVDMLSGDAGVMDQGADAADPDAPVISNLTYSPKQISANMQGTIIGSFQFSDRNADIQQMKFAIYGPDGARQQDPPTVSATQSQGQASGTQSLFVSTVQSMTGTMRFEVWEVDQAGHESNHLVGPVDVQ